MGINYQPLAATATFSRISQRRPTDRAEIVVRAWIVPRSRPRSRPTQS